MKWIFFKAAKYARKTGRLASVSWVLPSCRTY